jgi:single-strand DNA-binding protein
MNFITITGNLGKDAETRFTPNGDPVASFSVADNQGKDKPSIWWNCALFGKRAESLAPYLKKGQTVTVVGQVSEREYTDKNTGQQRKAMDVRVTDVALQGGKRDDQAPAPQPARQRPAAPAGNRAPAPSGFDDIDF